jgi:hypothetical protein
VTGIAVLTSATDPAAGIRAVSDALDEAVRPRALLARAIERARQDTSEKEPFTGAASPDASAPPFGWKAEDFEIQTKYLALPEGTMHTVFFGLAARPFDVHCEVYLVMRPLKHESQVGAGAEIDILYAFPREGPERTWGIRFWQAVFAEWRAATRRGLRTVGILDESLPLNGRERD